MIIEAYTVDLAHNERRFRRLVIATLLGAGALGFALGFVTGFLLK